VVHCRSGIPLPCRLPGTRRCRARGEGAPGHATARKVTRIEGDRCDSWCAARIVRDPRSPYWYAEFEADAERASTRAHVGGTKRRPRRSRTAGTRKLSPTPVLCRFCCVWRTTRSGNRPRIFALERRGDLLLRRDLTPRSSRAPEPACRELDATALQAAFRQ
jgi:hypothetical protein